MTAPESCPKCGSIDIEYDGKIEGDGMLMYQQVKCPECGAKWHENYVYDGWEMDE